MSEIAIFPIDDKVNTTYDIQSDNTIEGHGVLNASFSMVNVTDERLFTDIKTRGWQIFVSNMPLDTGLYWLMYLKTERNLSLRYTQGAQILHDEDFEVYYRTCRKPLILGNINANNQLPYCTKLQYIRLEDDRLTMTQKIQSTELSYNSIGKQLSIMDCKTILQHYLNKNGGTELKFIVYGPWQQIGFTVAGLVQPLCNNDVKKFKIVNLKEPVPCYIYQDQGMKKYVVEQYATKKLTIDDKDYYIGDLNYFEVNDNETENE